MFQMISYCVSEFCDRLFRNLSDLNVQLCLSECFKGGSNENPKCAIRFETLLCAAVETASYQHGFEACTV